MATALNLNSKGLIDGLAYLDSVIGTGGLYSSSDLLATGIVPACRCLVSRIYKSSSVYRVPNGVTLANTQSKRTVSGKAKLSLVVLEPSDAYPEMACDMAAKIGQFLLFSESIPQQSLVVCCDATVVGDLDGTALERHGITVLYDDRERRSPSLEPAFSTDVMSVDSRGHVVWGGDIPLSITEYQGDLALKGLRDSVTSELRQIIGDMVSIPHETQDDAVMYAFFQEDRELPALVAATTAMSYGSVNLEYILNATQPSMRRAMTFRDREGVDWMLGNVVFRNKVKLADAMPDIAEPDYAEISDVTEIWRQKLDEHTVSIGRNRHVDVKGVQDLGVLLGVDSMVKAYYSGVPIADILA